MKKSIHEICLTAVNSSSSPNLHCHVKRNISPLVRLSQQKGLSQYTKEIMSSAIKAINVDKRYSILTVPRTPCRIQNTSKDLITYPSSKLEISDNLSTAGTTDTNRTAGQVGVNNKMNLQKKCCRIRSGYRFRKNPNQENLKLALEEIAKNPPKRAFLIERSNTQEPQPEKKSDIEVLLTSQGNEFLNIKNSKKTKKRISTKSQEPSKTQNQSNLSIQPNEKDEDNQSQISDPSPVRKRKSSNDDFSKSSQKKLKKLTKNPSSKFKFYTSSKAGKEFLDKHPDKSLILDFAYEDATPLNNISINKSFYDYRQESLKILKDTSSFANKIMKGIRCPGRIKKCYF
ncbi:hypothetical protein SteCoe_8058 [Stentor coeruleus]|uniref:Uncharacterized protein n=1 Tax=Stentor coeruleus TaxID=5963 RepID=A0A1R2CL49_9CILI|nr:hypothetical protein SteCoe_8058 [Stentor coeruleus]